MLTNLFFPAVAGVRVERLWRDGATIHLEVVATRRWARCPLCQRRSTRPHSRYERTLADLPCGGDRVVLHLHVRRFVCRPARLAAVLRSKAAALRLHHRPSPSVFCTNAIHP